MERRGHGHAGQARWSLWSEGSVLSVGSRNSALSIGSVGSVLSIGSIGSAASVLSVGSAASVGSALSSLSRWSLLSFRGERAVAGMQDGRQPRATAWLAAVAAAALVADLLVRRRRP